MQACGFEMQLADGSSTAEEGTLSLPMHHDLTACRATYHLLQTAVPASPGELAMRYPHTPLPVSSFTCEPVLIGPDARCMLLWCGVWSGLMRCNVPHAW